MPKSKYSVKSSFLQSPEILKKENINTKRTRRHSGFKLSLIISIVLLLLFIATLAIIAFGGIFNITNYNIKGNSQISTVDIEGAVKKETYNKLILNIDPASIGKKLQDEFSLLSFVRVTKELPSTLNIEVQERSKAVAIKTLENVVLVSQDGSVVQEIDPSHISNNTYQGVKIVSMIQEPKRSVGYKFDADFINSIVKFVNNWSKLNAPAYTDILIDNDKNTRVVLSSGTIILLSLMDNNLDTEKLINDVVSVYNRLSTQKKIKTIDVRFDKIAVST